MKWNLVTAAALVAIGPLVGFRSVAAQSLTSPTDGITVFAAGETKVKPNKLEIEIKTSVSAELTGDAVVKYRDALKRAKEAIDKLKLDNLQVLDQGVNIAGSGAGAGPNGVYQVATPAGIVTQGNSSGVKQEVAISKSLRLAVGGLDKLSEEDVIAMVAKLLDVVKDAGMAVNNSVNTGENGPDGQPLASPLVQFVATDISAAHKQAVQQAFQRAKEKVQHIAELTGGQLGPTCAVEETETVSNSNEDSAAMGMLTAIYSGGSVGGDDTSLKSPLLAEIPVRVSLRVRFALQPNNPSTSNGATK